MAIIDRINDTQVKITAAQADITEYQQLVSDRDTAQARVAMLAGQLKQEQDAHVADLNADLDVINGLKAQLAQAQSDLATANANLATAQASLLAAQAQIAQLQRKTYPDLEYTQFALNLKPDSASGRGTGSFTVADTGVPAVFSISPLPPLTGQTDNYFNIYATQKKKANAAYKNFVLTGRWDFPTDSDMNTAHAIEMEARQVLPDRRMAVPALQLRFGGNEPQTLRYFNAQAPGDNWVNTGIALPRQRSIAVVMEAHRDDTNFVYDAMTINGVKHNMSFIAPLYTGSYIIERLSVSLQLDSHYLAGAYKVQASGVNLSVW